MYVWITLGKQGLDVPWALSFLMEWHTKPRQLDKIVPHRAEWKSCCSVWLPGPEVCRKLEGSWPDCTRQCQNFTLLTKRDWIWCCLAQSGQLPSIFLPIFGPAIFCLAPSSMILSGCLGLGVARASCGNKKTQMIWMKNDHPYRGLHRKNNVLIFSPFLEKYIIFIFGKYPVEISGNDPRHIKRGGKWLVNCCSILEL